MPDESVDVVLLYDVFQMISDKDKLLEELHRVLKSDGILFATAEHLDPKEFMNIFAKRDLFTLIEQSLGEVFRFKRDCREMGNFGDTYIVKKKKLKRGSMETEKGEEAYGQIWDKNEIKPEVENTFIPYFSIFFNLFSLDQKPISCPLLLKDRDRPTYGTSFRCEDNIFY